MQALRNALLSWYETHRRRLPWRENADPYRIWVSEVMLQQTQVATVIPYYHRFVAAFPDVHRLARARQQEVLKLWEGLGYYARARNLHRAAGEVDRVYGGRIPESFAELRKLPGVGDYIAAAVLSIAFQRPYAVLDGNVKRVLARLQALDLPVDQPAAQRRFRALAQELLDTRRPGEFNQAVMELGALVCTPRRPDCGGCPLMAACSAFQTGRVAEYPKRRQPRAVPLHHIAVGVVRRGDRLLITRRKSEGLLGGLWEFPGGKLKPGESAAEACVREILEEVNLQVQVLGRLTRVRHAYTHFRICMDVFTCRFMAGEVRLNGPADYRWVRPNEIDAYPFPRANRKFIPLLLATLAQA
jgi:A/G-specific adenine glycosylase